MPELPEVQALVDDLGGRLIGRRVDQLQVQSFAALKTFDPPVSALSGQLVEEVARHGKFLDLTVGGIHVIVHLARAGWVRWRENAPQPSKGLGKGPIAARLVLDDGSGFDLTEAGTKKSLAIYLVRSPLDVPGIARLGPDPLAPSFTVAILASILGAQGRSRSRACCATSRSSPASGMRIRTRSCTWQECRRSSRHPWTRPRSQRCTMRSRQRCDRPCLASRESPPLC